MKKLLIVPLLAACTMPTTETDDASQTAATAGIYSSFDAKGGGQVLADQFVAPPGATPADIAEQLAGFTPAPAQGDCWDGTSGARLGPLLLCRPKPNTIKVINDGDDQIVVSSASNGSGTSGNGDPDGGGTSSNGGSTTNEENTPVAGFVSKYDRIEQVYGTTEWTTLPDEDQTAIRDYFAEQGGDTDWSGFEAPADTGGTQTSAPEAEPAGGDATGGDASGGDEAGGDASGDDAAGEEANGEDAAGEDANGGDQAAADGSGTDGEVATGGGATTAEPAADGATGEDSSI